MDVLTTLLSVSWSAKQLACTALRYARLLICRPGNGQHTLPANALRLCKPKVLSVSWSAKQLACTALRYARLLICWPAHRQHALLTTAAASASAPGKLAAQPAVTRLELTWLKLLTDARKAGKAQLLQPGRKMTSKCLARLCKPKLLSLSWSAKQLACTALRYACLLICQPGNGQHTLLTAAAAAAAAGQLAAQPAVTRLELTRLKLLTDARKAGKAQLLQPGRKMTSKCRARLCKLKFLSVSWSAKQLACTALRYARLLICWPAHRQHTWLTTAAALAAGQACSKACCD